MFSNLSIASPYALAVTYVDPHSGVMHVITSLDPGGAEGQLVALAIRRQTDGYPPTVVSLLDGGLLRDRLLERDIAVMSLGMQRGRISLGAISRLARLIRRIRPDVIQSWMYHSDLLSTAALFLSGCWSSTRFYWGVRCSDMDVNRYGRDLKRVIRICAGLSRLPDGIVVNSEAGRTAHINIGYAPTRFTTILNGIDTNRFRPDTAARQRVRTKLGVDRSTCVLAHVARVDPMKDHATLRAALDRLPDVVGLAIGTGTEALAPHPRLHRLSRRTDLPILLAASDIVVSSSAFGEGFSNAIAEGMACGLPAVATDVGDSSKIIGGCGSTVSPGDPIAFAQAITDVRGLDLSTLGRMARTRIQEKYSLDRMAAAFAVLHGA